MSEAADGMVGRYQIVVIGKEGAVLLDTATGSSWSLARDIDTLQLGWRPLEERWPGAMLPHAADRPRSMLQNGAPLSDQPVPGESPLVTAATCGQSAAWWRPSFGSKWSRGRQPSVNQT